MERLDKILSHAGLGTRRDVRRILHSGAVCVNGEVVYIPDIHIDLERDEILVDGNPLALEKNVYLMMNKVAGTVCTSKEGERQTVFERLDENYRTPYFVSHLHLVGRLDADTEGLLIFTTDGALTHKLISPKTRCEKKYFVRLKKNILPEERGVLQEKFSRGFKIPAEGAESEFVSLPAKIEFTENANEVFLTICEGKFHQVKRMFRVFENEVLYLKRVQIGALALDENLAPGEYRKMTAGEVSLFSSFSCLPREYASNTDCRVRLDNDKEIQIKVNGEKK